ncbi:IS110 family transposase [Pseudomonas daroniae]|uniref:IS110 family transposase n=1 Tax=Phytopseudomonas daroniae TaxID=2487519 RepID=A0A4Q9QS45_9GAMM|nr:IS110 family transposase [Pseudomonas daroniae]TBU84028.1 IS110 family transposase [Pseudomonas daroniae]TBU93206.1 IS110 family transposase [Pseudomonas daroniae]
MSTVVGIDVAKHTFDIATLQANGKHRTKAKLANDPKGFEVLLQWLNKHAEAQAWIVMEATGIYHEALAEWLYERGYQVCVLNPAQIAFYARSQLQRVKTDKVDAKLIADYGHRHQKELRAWKPEQPSIKRLKALTHRLKDLQELEQMEQNRLDVTSDAKVAASIQSVLGHIRQQIADTLKAIKQHFDDNDDLRGQRDLLKSIDGIADRTAALLLAELGDIRRFDDSRAVTAFAGLNPRLQESGKHKGHVRISRMGSALLRGGLYLPAVTSLTYNSAIRAMAERLRAKGKTGKQIVCAAMRKLLCIAYGVLKSGQPFNPQLAIAR